MHLGLIVELETHNGQTIIGRVDAADERAVYLGRTRHRTVPLSDLKTVLSVKDR